MEILQSIGLDQTILFQIFIFLVTFVCVNQLVFKPYFKAFEERKKRTTGNKQLAEAALEETKSLELEYESKARIINTQQKSFYDKSRAEALHEYDQIVNDARARAKKIVDENKSQIQKEVAKARVELGKEVPTVGAAIATRLLGKEVKI